MRNTRWFFLVLSLCVLVLWPLARPGLYLSDDAEWMVIRLTAFFQSFREGQFPVRFLGRLNHEYGYPVANFLYPGFLYIGSFLHGLGLSFVDSVKVIFAGSIVGAAWFLFLWLRIWFSQFASLIGIAAFIFSPYLLFDLYVRGSVGEVLAFFPATIGLYSIEKNKKTLLAVSIAFLILSHNTLAMLFIAIFLLRILILGAFDFVIPVILGLGMSGFFWLPALFERTLVVFDEVRVSHPGAYFATSNRLALSGIVSIIACVVLLFRKHKGDNRFFVAIFVISTLLATAVFEPLWNLEGVTKLVQFPYRFLAVASVFGSWLVAASVWSNKKYSSELIILFSVLWFITAWPILQKIEYVQRPEGFYTTNEGTTTVADEYMPQWAMMKAESRPATKFEFVKGDGIITPTSSSTQRLEADVITEDVSTVQINTLYYPGWGITIDGVRVPVSFENPRGVMQIEVPAGNHRLISEFRETPGRFIADALTVISGIVVLIFAMKYRR